MNKDSNNILQALCRDYLCKLRYMSAKHGLKSWIDETIKANKRGECEATEKEVSMLSRLCDDERVARKDVPKIFGKSYRQLEESNTFKKIKKLRHVGIYSKVSALLLSNKYKSDNK